MALVAVVAPLLVLVAAFGAKFGVLTHDLAWRVLTWQVAWAMAFVGAAAALAAVVTAARDWKRRGLTAFAAVVIAAATLGGFLYQQQLLAASAPFDVSSDVSNAPAFSAAVSRQRQADGATEIYVHGGPQDCRGLRTVRTQVAPGVAAWALQEAGFTPLGAAAFRANGRRESFWYGFVHDAEIRIRPGQTDVHVAARYAPADGGEACRRAIRLVEALDQSPRQAGR
ncbi:hypothetical protein ASG17_06315 [Brevundimonas sp. Leaf363]|uniref:DUF1499 domain-containing protein n=1 Tax=Brevundimonas sp. Leaf363 TaxID=1736353 RepID=UPI0006F810DC|nr:DUF1499 domain-containing protein [Brevundimonas sp. Leaf363]KQS55678.1 hypothetical protein ASG17_06315 [Brevundimonas sp. Leaf363]